MSRILSWILFAVGLAAAVGAYLWWSAGKGPPPPPPPRPPFVLPATVAPVERGTLDAKATLTGTVRSIREAKIGFAIGGTVATIDVREGDVVKATTPLATLDAKDQDARLAAAKADTALARAELRALEAGTRTEELRRLEAQVQAAQAEVEWAGAEVARLKPLADDKVVSVSSYEEMVGKRDAAQGRLEAARQALMMGRAGSREEDLAVQRARVAAREAAEALAQREIDKTKLTAPFDGQVIRRLAAPGDAVNAGQAVLELVDLQRREVELEIPAATAERLGKRPRVTLTLDERRDVRVDATLDSLVGAADARSRSYRGIVRLGEGIDDAGQLRPGVFVRATLHLEPLTDVLLVPSDAVRAVEKGSIVVKAAPPKAGPAGPPPGPGPSMPPPSTAELIPVRVLSSWDGKTAIEPLTPTLAAGDRVVVVGVDRMFAGAMVMARDVAPAAPTPTVAPPAKAP